MKLLILLTVVASFQATARGFGQTISLSLKDAPLETAFREIKKQSGYSFIFTRIQLRNTQPVSVDVKNASINEVLKLCFQNQPLSFVIEGMYVVVRTKQANSQLPKDIKGKIINANGEPVASATIVVANSSIATSSDVNGDFAITDVEDNALLVISCVGYKTKQIGIKGNSFITIELEIAVTSLDETIIKGYYSTSRRLNTGSVSKVTEKEIINQPVSNPLATLEGRVAGLFITQANGLPGSNFTVRIRGQNSIQNGNSPLFIIDGVPFLNDAERLAQRSGINANSPFNNINPGDIESIEILKDADATAIYGSRGANGVILITTKKGTAGKTSVDANIYSGWGKVTRTMDYMNTFQYLAMRREAFSNDGMTPTVNDAPDLLIWDTTRYVDWKKLLIGNTAKFTNVQLRLSGGSATLKYTASANYYKESTVFPGDYFDQRASFGLNIIHISNDKKFNAAFVSNYSSNHSDLPAQDFTQYINLPPNMYEPYQPNGTLNWSEGGYSYGNPYGILSQKNKGITNRLTANSILSYKLFNLVNLKITSGYNDIRFDETIHYPIAAQNPAFNPKGSATFGTNHVKTWIVEPQAEYTGSISDRVKVSGLIGATWQESENSNSLTQGSGYTNDALIGSAAGAATVTASNTYSKYRYQAVFGRFNFNWSDKYLLNLTGRRDGSSRFGPEQRYATFGAIGAAWIFTQEKAIERSLPFLSYGKLRASYGITGNDQIGNYQYLDSWTVTQYPYQGSSALRPSRLYNPDYSWEQNRKLETGVEIGLFKDDVYMTVNWFRNRTDNQIIRYSLPAQTGFVNILRNFPGIVQNSGWEVDIRTTNVKTTKLEWHSSFNISIIRNKLIEFPGIEKSTYSTTYFIGKSLNTIRGLRYLGLDTQTGIYTFEDINRDGMINSFDYVPLGTTDPSFYGGFQNSIKCFGFDLDFLFQYVKQKGSHAIYKLQNAIGGFVNQPIAVIDHWRKPGDTAPYERYTQDFSNPAYYPATFNVSESDIALTDASFIRLKNISLSYYLRQDWISKLKIDKCRVFFQGQNLLTITKYKGSDPESQNLTSLPPLKLITIGIQVTF